MSDKKFSGKCLCGSIHYTVNGDLLGVINCHCSMCRRWHGNFAAYAVAQLADFKITRGADKLKWYASSEKVKRGYCPECGSSLFKDNGDGEKMVLAVGALDAPTDLKFMKNIHEDGKGDYYDLPGA